MPLLLTFGNLDGGNSDCCAGAVVTKMRVTVVMQNTLKNRSHLKRTVTLGKLRETWKNGSHLEKWNTLIKIGPV